MLTAFTSNWLIFFPLGFSLFVALRLSQGSRDDGRASRGSTVARCLIAMLFAFSLLAVGLRSHVLSFFWLILLAFFAGVILWKNRRLERSALLLTALHAQTSPRQLSLTESFWTENSGWLRRKAAALRRDYSAGTSWWKSLEQRGIAKGVYESLAVRLIAIYGPANQAKSCKQAAGELLTPLQIEAEIERLLGRLSIFSWMVLGFPLVSMIVVFIFPVLKEILEDSAVELPPALLAADAAVTVVSDHLALIGKVLVPLAITFVPLAIWIWFTPAILQLYPFRWLCNDYFRTAGFSALSNAIEHENSLPLACGATASLLVVEDLSRQYRAAARMMEEGVKPQQALLQAGLLSRREMQAFQSGLSEQDPSWCLQQLASWRMQRMLARYSIWIQCAIVIVTLLVAIVVGFMAVGVLQVLSSMITSLAEN